MTKIRHWEVCPDCGAEGSIKRIVTDPAFMVKKEVCTKCGKNVTGKVIMKSYENNSGWKA